MEDEIKDPVPVEETWISMEPVIRKWIARLVSDSNMREVMLSCVKCRVFKYREKIESIEQTQLKAGYIQKIVRSCCMDQQKLLRAEYGLPWIEIADCDMAYDYDMSGSSYDPVDDRIRCMALMEEIAALPVIYSELLFLIIRTGGTSAELSNKLGIDIQTFRKRRQRARSKLLERMNTY